MALNRPFKNIPQGQKRKRDFNGPARHDSSNPAARAGPARPQFQKQGQREQDNPARHKLSEQRKQLLRSRAELPIWPHTSAIRLALAGDRHVLVLVGETGSGKSTQVPQFLMSESWCKGAIAVTEPRRVAATSLARRVAEEVGTPLGTASPGSKVGYSVRFDPNFAPGTKIKFLTEGMLLQEMLRDPWLTKYSVVIVDEVHERGVNVDLILGFLRKILAAQKREKGKQEKWRKGAGALKVVVMSATADTEKLFHFFEEAFEPRQLSDPGAEKEQSKETIIPSVNGIVNGALESHEKEDASLDKEDYDSESSWSGISSSEVSGDERDASTTAQNGHQENDVNITEKPRHEEIEGDFCESISTLYIEGRQHPVETFYAPSPTLDFVEATLKTIFQVHLKEPLPGDILVFLTGQDVVESLETMVNEHATGMAPEVPKLLVLPLFAALPHMAQQRVFQPAPPRTRKVILATNIAETSVTIPGVRFVIDCGLAKIKEYRSQLGLDSLLVKPISKSAAIQRKGRAGREAPGKCYRLYTESDYLKLDTANTPEILRTDLAMSLLIMKARGIPDTATFPYLDPPRRDAMRTALAQLHRLDALDAAGGITQTGRRMAQLPLSPPLSRVLIASAAHGPACVLDVIDIIASMTVENIFLPLNNSISTSADDTVEAENDATSAARAALTSRHGDHLTFLAAVRAYAAEATDRKAWSAAHGISHRAMKAVMDVRKQLREQCRRQGLLSSSSVDNDAAADGGEEGDRDTTATTALKPFLAAYAPNLARLHPDGSYKTLQCHQTVAVHPSSVLFGRRKADLILYGELVYTSRCWARRVSVVEWEWLAEVVAGFDVGGGMSVVS